MGSLENSLHLLVAVAVGVGPGPGPGRLGPGEQQRGPEQTLLATKSVQLKLPRHNSLGDRGRRRRVRCCVGAFLVGCVWPDMPAYEKKGSAAFCKYATQAPLATPVGGSATAARGWVAFTRRSAIDNELQT